MAVAGRGRVLGLLTAGVGVGLAAAPTIVAKRAAGRAGPVPDSRIVRVLGLRQVAQGLVTAVTPQRRVLAAGAAADAMHALSMAALAEMAPRYRRPALTSATLALATAAAGAALAAQGAGQRPRARSASGRA